MKNHIVAITIQYPHTGRTPWVEVSRVGTETRRYQGSRNVDRMHNSVILCKNDVLVTDIEPYLNDWTVYQIGVK